MLMTIQEQLKYEKNEVECNLVEQRIRSTEEK